MRPGSLSRMGQRFRWRPSARLSFRLRLASRLTLPPALSNCGYCRARIVMVWFASANPRVAFRCNICGTRNRLTPGQMSREAGECAGCGSTVRMRCVIRCLSLALFGQSVCLADLAVDRSIRGAGLGDWDGYATRLTSLFTYANTLHHAQPPL